MKRYFFYGVFGFTICNYSMGQVICVSCYDQNAPITVGANNLVLNGGFENGCGIGTFFCPNASTYNCNITGWICTGGGINTYAHIVNSTFSIIPEGTKAVYFGNWFWDICSPDTNDESCLIAAGCMVSGVPPGFPSARYPGYGDTTGISIQQTVTGLIPCTKYILEFWAGGEDNFYLGLFAVDVGYGNIFLRERRTPPPLGIGKRFLIEFNATSTAHTIKFTQWGHISQLFTELVLDDVRLYASSELDTVSQCPTEEPDFIYNLPNVFTPNGDGMNDLFHPCNLATNAEMQLPCPAYSNVSNVDIKFFNRWGNLVFETKDRDINWDGKNKFSGQNCPDGVYYYTGTVNFNHFCMTGSKDIHGFLHIMRK